MSGKNTEDLIEGATEQQLIEIRKELNENEDKFQHNLKLLKEWVRCQEYLPQNYDENMLHVVLHGRENKLDRAKEKFRNYFIAKSKITGPEHLKFLVNQGNDKQLNNFGFFPLRKLTHRGYRVYLFYVKSPDFDLFDADLYIKSCIPLRHLMYCKEGRIAGDYVIMDGTNFGPRHCAKSLTPFVIRFVTMMQKLYPVIMKQIHFINTNPHIEKALILLRQLLKEKIRQRIVVHQNSHTELSKYFPIDILPLDYGGKEESKEELFQKWRKCIRDNEAWFIDQYKIVNCSEGNIPQNDLDEALDEGSFRKLDID